MQNYCVSNIFISPFKLYLASAYSTELISCYAHTPRRIMINHSYRLLLFKKMLMTPALFMEYLHGSNIHLENERPVRVQICVTLFYNHQPVNFPVIMSLYISIEAMKHWKKFQNTSRQKTVLRKGLVSLIQQWRLGAANSRSWLSVTVSRTINRYCLFSMSVIVIVHL